VLLNRAPTLHRLGIQAFEPVSSSKVQPFNCTRSFVPPSTPTSMATRWLCMYLFLKRPCRKRASLMLASKNLLKPADGEPIISPSKDMVLGVFT
jgi:DNA-directed RNA polymerase subunit beta'